MFIPVITNSSVTSSGTRIPTSTGGAELVLHLSGTLLAQMVVVSGTGQSKSVVEGCMARFSEEDASRLPSCESVSSFESVCVGR